MIRLTIQNILRLYGEWDIKLKNRNEIHSDYTRIQLKAFWELLVVAVCTALAIFCVVILRGYGLGENYPLLVGITLLLGILLLFVIFVFAKRYMKPFQDIDRQLDALLSDDSSEIHLPKELAFTEQKLGALKQAMEKRLFDAQLAEQRKNDLVTYLAHDIRTPLTSVVGYLNLLDEAKDMPEEQREKYTRITLDKAYRLEKMINEFFEITRYSLQQIQLNKGTVALCYMLVQLTDELLPVLARNGNTAVIKMDNEDITVYGDREKLARVFNNILRNAAAYSYPNTEIVISAEEHDGNVEIKFRNQGKMLPPEKLETIFEKFYRMDDARNSDSGGTGLGLAISKEIITLHGGTVRAESENDTVTFIVTIPLENTLS